MNLYDLVQAVEGRSVLCECCKNTNCKTDGCEFDGSYNDVEELGVKIVMEHLSASAKKKVEKWLKS